MLEDRVKETTTTTGTGNLTTAGAATNFRTFNTAFGTNRRFFYWIVDDTNSDWEHGVGYLSGTTTLVREKVLSSTNAGAAVNLSAGTKDVFCGPSISSSYGGSVGFHSLSSSEGIHLPTNFIRLNATFALVADRIYYVPYWITRPVLVDTIWHAVTTGSGSSPPTNVYHAGFYDTDPDNGQPGNLLFSVADLDPSSTAADSGTFTETLLMPGWYWAAAWTDVTPTVRANDAAIETMAPFGGQATNAPHGTSYLYQSATSLSDLPATAAPTLANESANPLVCFIGHS